MTSKMAKFSEHSFYCINCGKKMISLPRKNGHNYKKHHRKKLWCPWCKMEVNGIECKNDNDVYDFLEAFKAGEYKEEVANSINYIQNEHFFK